MKPPPRPSILLKAIQFSLALNSVMVVTGVLSSLFARLSWLSVISSILALPPAVLVGWMLKPKAANLIAVAVSGIEAIFFAIAFYTLVAWLVLLYWPQLRAIGRRASRKDSGADPKAG